MAQDNPLTREHYDLVNSALRDLYDADSLMPKCRNCGLDTTQAEQASAELRQNLESIKREFFPGMH